MLQLIASLFTPKSTAKPQTVEHYIRRKNVKPVQEDWSNNTLVFGKPLPKK